MTPGPFHGRTLCIATMHGKQRVIAPQLAARVGVHCIPTSGGFDTDRFGTFSGEVPRTGSALDAARAKAHAALGATAVDLAVASEGSFFPHPDACLLQVGVELLLLVDLRLGIEIVAEHATTATNHARSPCRSLDEALAFGARVGFPAHGLLVLLGDPPRRVWRGLQDPAALAAAVQAAVAASERDGLPCWVATDMRAHQNPTRMLAIECAAAALAERMATACPECGLPGFGKSGVVRGLPCAACGAPTARVRADVHTCVRCPARREIPRQDGRRTADPAGCDACNP